jgi:hypothetical protein
MQVVLRGVCKADAKIVWAIRNIQKKFLDTNRSGSRGQREDEDNT